MAPAPAEFQLKLAFAADQQALLYLPTDNQRQYPVQLKVTAQRLALFTNHQHKSWVLPAVAPYLLVTCTIAGFTWRYGKQSSFVPLPRLPQQRLVILGSQSPLDYQVTIWTK
ncbi:hypothetical protein ACFQZ7_03115 [Loigolactobacillus binensis]|uniref:Uncharacterized protein n=1 Tax=Loigolactobacillus binensis TaxID=2559922 RepID=A0ABW3EAM0_9LACO